MLNTKIKKGKEDMSIRRGGFYDLFDALWNNELPSAVNYRKVNSPAVNVLESEEEYTVQIAAPGLTKEDISIKLDEEDNLVISMQKKEEKSVEAPQEKSDSTEVAEVDHKPVRYLRREFLNQSYVQRMSLPEDANLEGISAKVENGVLEVCIKRLTETQKQSLQRTIDVD